MTGAVVVGMTSIPSRLALIEPALDSLRHQTRVPDRIVLSLPEHSRREGVPYVVPDELRRAADAGEVDIVTSPDDYGPGTKLLGALPAVGDDDVFIALDDDQAYRPFVIEELSDAVRATGRAASFYTYSTLGLTVGQGADGLAMPGRVARGMTAIIPLLDAHPEIRSNDDYWISFLLARAGVSLDSLAARLPHYEVERCYEVVHDVNSLLEEAGPSGRSAMNLRIHRTLFRHAQPTWRMRARVPIGYAVAASRRIRRRLPVGS